MLIKTIDIDSEIDNRRLAKAYVVLALARDAAKNYMEQKPDHEGFHPVVTMLDITNDLLEEILEHSMPPDASPDPDDDVCSDLSM
jgi:hypothetical protein